MFRHAYAIFLPCVLRIRQNGKKTYFVYYYKMEPASLKSVSRKLPELKAEAKRLGLNNYSRLRKQELIDLLRNQNRPIPASRTEKPIPTPIERPIPAPRTKKIETFSKRKRKKDQKIEKEADNNQSKTKNQQKEKNATYRKNR